jgi:hypothetical protein
MNKTRPVNYGSVLADLRAQRERIDAAIRAIEALIAPPPPATAPPAPPPPPKELAIAHGAFRGLSLLDASKKYLQSKGECQRTRDIVRALQHGGIALSGKSPINTVGAILNTSLKKGGGIVRVKRGVWSLASWQSPSLNGAAATLDGLHAAMPIRLPTRPTASAAHA